MHDHLSPQPSLSRESTLPRDPQLPWLATALDRTAMSEHFARSVLPAFNPGNPEQFALQGCDIDHVRYRPGRNCAIAYRLKVLDTRTAQCHDLRFHGRMYPPASAISRHAKASDQRLERPPLGPPLHLIAPLDMVLWAFPNERKLAGLGAVLEPARLEQEVLPEVISRRWGEGWTIQGCRSDVVHYVPEHTLTLRVQMTLRHRTTGERRPVVAYGKCYHDDQGMHTLATMTQLDSLAKGAISRSGGGRHERTLRIPRPICYQPRHRLLWQDALPGVPLADLMADPVASPTLMRQAGEQIRALHRSDVATDLRIDYRQLISRVNTVEPLLARQLDGEADLVHGLAGRLRDAAPTAAFDAVLLHGDLHAKNFLVGRGGTGLIDLDNCVRGPAAWDLGSFIAALLTGASSEGISGAGTRGHIEWLLSGYEFSPDPRSAKDLNWCIACALFIERAYRSVSRLKAGRLASLPGLLRQANAVLDAGWQGALQ